jgi:toxin ParE1/3/4
LKPFTFSPAANRDIADIWLYTADRRGIDQADRYIRQIEHDLTAAASGSPLVRPIDDNTGHHVCVFRKTAEGRIVTRLLHERRDVESHIE